MRRKVFAPETIVAVLFAITTLIMAIVFALQSRNVKIMYGQTIREDVYDVNSLTGDIPGLIESGSYSEMILAASKLYALDNTELLNSAIYDFQKKDAEALTAYADAVLKGEMSDAAVEMLKNDAINANSNLRTLVQLAISRLGNPEIIKMDKAFYKAMSPTSKVYREISILAKHLT